MSRVSKRDLIFMTHFCLYINQVSWEMSLFKRLEVYHLLFKYQHQYVFSLVCLSYILDSCVWLILFLFFFFCALGNLRTVTCNISLYYSAVLSIWYVWHCVLLIYVENWPSTLKFMWLIIVSYVHCIGIKNRELTN